MKEQQTLQAQRQQKTLLASLLVSVWAPLATGIAVALSRSVTQLADFIRRTMEFLVLLLSWLVFRYLSRREDLSQLAKEKLERTVNLSVSAALGFSGLLMIFLALYRLRSFKPSGSVLLGLTIAVLGLIVNLGFLHRYSVLSRQSMSMIIAAQRRLYLAKVFVDIGVVLALGTVAVFPSHTVTRGVDTVGSIIVAGYLLWSAFHTGVQVKKRDESLSE